MYSEDMKDFMVKVVSRSGLSQKGTYLPKAINPIHAREPINDMATAGLEAKAVMTGAVEDLLAKTGIRPEQVDILVTNCSIFCPTPSLASMLINHFKFRSDIQSYHLGGMGCGNGELQALQPAAILSGMDLLQARPNAIALFVPAEITTYAFYPGSRKQYMVANCIFRMGGAAILLSNKKQFSRTGKYQLQYNVRVHTGQDDNSYGCMSWGPDPDGINGVYLGKNVVSSQSRHPPALQIMTWGQYAEATVSIVAKHLGAEWPEYVPEYTKCADHFAIHAGGYAVLKGIQEGMALPAGKMLPSFAALRDYGNTSCSTTWYVMAYMESCEKVTKGQRILQVGMGGGMKAGVNVWRALQDNKCVHKAWMHLAAKPLTEADLPRAIEAIGPNTNLAGAAKGPAQPEAAKPVARKLTVEVKAYTESRLTDDQLADLAH
ncbi:FAE1/Type III polyketide synthase-like protein-domain-containing protein [Scenedesmus sp. NREL 46B-D3]|nr:FAE1/Type III polyketide synthase-like protein-domain-containing protein [Scenedesmus sp. NREL 46B-D3]